jgi:hypothetical protein
VNVLILSFMMLLISLNKTVFLALHRNVKIVRLFPKTIAHFALVLSPETLPPVNVYQTIMTLSPMLLILSITIV